MTVVTVGHGTLDAEAFAALVREAGVETVVDVRSHPGSRRHPHVARDEMARWLSDTGVGYEWEPRLGGRRRGVDGSPHLALRNDSFRAYADHMESEEFQAGVASLVGTAAGQRLAVMCAESVWWRCHRRLLADHLVLVEGVDVEHLMHDGRLVPHGVTDGARLADRRVVYDVGTDRPLL